MIFSTNFKLPFYAYGIILLLGFIAGFLLFYRNYSKFNSNPSLLDLSLVLSISGLIGARAYYILLFPSQFNGLRDWLAVHEGGLVFYGALIGALIGLYIFCKLKKVDLAWLMDMLAPSFALSHAIGRLGCISNHCCYGVKTDSIKIYHLPSDLHGVFRHPTHLYESIFLLCLCIVLNYNLNISKVKGWANGVIASAYLLSYSIFRFIIEFLRGDDRGTIGIIESLSPAQITSLILALSSLSYIVYAMLSQKSNRTKIYEQN